MRKRTKNKRASCGLCKPHKRGMDPRWKAKERAGVAEADEYRRNPNRGMDEYYDWEWIEATDRED